MMDELAALQARKAEIMERLGTMNDRLGVRACTPSEQAQWDAAIEEAERINVAIARIHNRVRTRADMAEQLGAILAEEQQTYSHRRPDNTRRGRRTFR
jgi:hypothetical protein